MAHDPKGRVGLILAHKREAVDRNGPGPARLRKPVSQEGVDRGASVGPDASRQGHVKAELLEHIRISPAIQIGGLIWLSPDARRRLRSCALIGKRESLERRDATRRQLV